MHFRFDWHSIHHKLPRTTTQILILFDTSFQILLYSYLNEWIIFYSKELVWLLTTVCVSPVLLLPPIGANALGTTSLILLSWALIIEEVLSKVSTSTDTVDTWYESKFTGMTKADGVVTASASESESESWISEKSGPVIINSTFDYRINQRPLFQNFWEKREKKHG